MFGIAWVRYLARRLIRGAAIPLLSTPAHALGIDDASSAAATSRVIGHVLFHENTVLTMWRGPQHSL